MRISCALQNKNRTFQTPDIPYFIIWSKIIFFWNISDHDVGSPPCLIWKKIVTEIRELDSGVSRISHTVVQFRLSFSFGERPKDIRRVTCATLKNQYLQLPKLWNRSILPDIRVLFASALEFKLTSPIWHIQLNLIISNAEILKYHHIKKNSLDTFLCFL